MLPAPIFLRSPIRILWGYTLRKFRGMYPQIIMRSAELWDSRNGRIGLWFGIFCVTLPAEKFLEYLALITQPTNVNHTQKRRRLLQFQQQPSNLFVTVPFHTIQELIHFPRYLLQLQRYSFFRMPLIHSKCIITWYKEECKSNKPLYMGKSCQRVSLSRDLRYDCEETQETDHRWSWVKNVNKPSISLGGYFKLPKYEFHNYMRVSFYTCRLKVIVD